jgi:hypothetical protein
MIELTDNIDFNNFLAELKPPGWYKRRSDESNVDWIKRVAIKDSGWLEKAKERERNRYWSKESSKFCLSVLSFLRENKIEKEKMEDDLNMEINLSSQYDYKMSEIVKIKKYMKDVNRSKL